MEEVIRPLSHESPCSVSSFGRVFINGEEVQQYTYEESGYRYCHIDGSTALVHRLVALAFLVHGNSRLLQGTHVRFKDGDPMNVHRNNLYLSKDGYAPIEAQDAAIVNRIIELTNNAPLKMDALWVMLRQDHKISMRHLKHLLTKYKISCGTKMYLFHGEYRSIAEWAKLYNIKLRTLRSRMDRGWTIQDALTKQSVTKHNTRVR